MTTTISKTVATFKILMNTLIKCRVFVDLLMALTDLSPDADKGREMKTKMNSYLFEYSEFYPSH